MLLRIGSIFLLTSEMSYQKKKFRNFSKTSAIREIILLINERRKQPKVKLTTLTEHVAFNYIYYTERSS